MVSESKRLVAVCDIMGFSRLVRSTPLEQIVEGHVRRLFLIIENSITQEEPIISFESVRSLRSGKRVGVAWFSDTILIYGLDDSDLSCSHVIEAVGWLLFRSFFDTPQTRIRAGVGYGKFYSDNDRSLFVGDALVDAYQAERTQNWIGGALSRTACERLRLSSPMSGHNWLRRDTPPVKPEVQDAFLGDVVIDWTFGSHDFMDIPWSPSNPEPSAKELEDIPDICEKWLNTKRFHQRACQWCRIAYVQSRIGDQLRE